MAWNNDLRTELAHVESVRTWPVAPARFMLAEVVSPAIMTFAGSTFGAGIAPGQLFRHPPARTLFTGEPTDMHLLPQSGEVLGVANDCGGGLALRERPTVDGRPVAPLLGPPESRGPPGPGVDGAQRRSQPGHRGVGPAMISSFALGLTFMLSLDPQRRARRRGASRSTSARYPVERLGVSCLGSPRGVPADRHGGSHAADRGPALGAARSRGGASGDRALRAT